MVSEETEGQPEPTPVYTGGDLTRVDSLLMAGRMESARATLLEALRNGDIPEEEAILRLVGSYHARGREDRCLRLLDSLELAGYGPLTGWKVSLLDMARRPDESEALAGADNPLLLLWLRRDADSLRYSGLSVLPPPKGLVERLVRVEAVDPGQLTLPQLEVAAADAAFLPQLEDRLQIELEKMLFKPGEAWERIYSTAGDPSDQGWRLLRARRLQSTGLGSRQELEQLLSDGGESGAIAAEELLRRWPEQYSTSWDVVDALCEQDRCSKAEAMLTPSAPEFSVGARMSLLRAARSYGPLLELCDSLLNTESSSRLRARALLFSARAHRAAGRNEAAFEAYADLASIYSWHPKAREGAYLAGKYFDGEQDWPSAADAYLASLRSDGVWEGDSRAYWRGGFCLYMSGRGAVGDSLWQMGIQRYPYSYWRDEMLFWRARYAARTGRDGEAQSLLEQVAEEHPWEFYGVLARLRLGLPRLPAPRPLPTSVTSTPEGRLTLALMESGYGGAIPEMLRDGRSGDRMVRARILALLGETRAAMTLMRRVDTDLRDSETGMLPDGMLPFYFPDPYGDLAREVATDLSLSPWILQAIMREESYFDRWVVSWAGARGLIQLMPGTAGDVARWYGLPRLSEEEFYVPENSILYGALYINRQYESFSGLEPLFLAAYNAGPGNARRWVDMHGWDPDDPELYIEQITYRETRMYVKKVLRSAWIYEGRQ